MKKIESLTQQQIDAMPGYVERWTAIGRSTEPANPQEAKKYIDQAYTNVGLKAPTYHFHLKSPISAVHAIFQVEVLSSFSDSDTSTDVVGDTSVWLPVFNSVYEQYQAQYNQIEWSKEVYDRMVSKISKAYVQEASKGNEKLTSLTQHMLYGNQESFWLSYYDFFLREFGEQASFCDPIKPFIELANHIGWWSAYPDVIFTQERPNKISVNENNQLHCVDGPAVEYPDGHKIYALCNYLVDAVIIENPELITVEMINEQQNTEVRRMMMEIFGMDRYFDEAVEEVIDRDFTIVDPNTKTMMPRMLVRTKNKDVFLVGSDGSTERVYYMPIALDALERRLKRKIRTCKEAHELISGIPESKILAQS